MHYDPIKKRLAGALKNAGLRRVFHLSLDLLFLRAWYVRRELERIASKREVSTILDAGMGFGQYSDRMLRLFRNASVTGLELDRPHLYGSEPYFSRFGKRSRITLGDVRRLPLKDTQFDLILTVDVMEHVDDDVAAFSEYHRVLKPGGTLVMHTPRDSSTGEPHEHQPDGHDHWSVDEHVRDGYRDDDAREKITAAGFTIERIVRGYGPPGKFAWTLLQRVPLTILHTSLWLAPVAVVWLLLAFIPALVAMELDLIPGDRPDGGSLMVVARKP